MTDRLLHALALDRDEPRPPTIASIIARHESRDDDSDHDCGAFGCVRGLRERAVMLELRLRTGNIVAIGYSWIEKVEYDPSEGIVIHAHGHLYRIKGRNLNAEQSAGLSLLQGILRHRVLWVQETAHHQDESKVTVVTRIA